MRFVSFTLAFLLGSWTLFPATHKCLHEGHQNVNGCHETTSRHCHNEIKGDNCECQDELKVLGAVSESRVDVSSEINETVTVVFDFISEPGLLALFSSSSYFSYAHDTAQTGIPVFAINSVFLI